MYGKLYIVATPIGNLSDISQRAIDILRSVDIVAAEDTRRTLGLLSHFGINVPVVSNYKHNEQKRSHQLIDRILNENLNVAVVSDAGTPCISDPGSHLTKLARQNGIEVFAIPGASAVMSALSVSGFDFTQFTFKGFIPRTNKEKAVFFDSMNNSDIPTFVFFESPKRIIPSLKDLSKIMPSCEIIVLNDITKFHERSYWGLIDDVINQLNEFPNSHLGEYTVVLNKTQKNEPLPTEIVNNLISIEALILDEMVKSNCTIKEASAKLTDRGEVSRNDTYKAAIKLKQMFE